MGYSLWECLCAKFRIGFNKNELMRQILLLERADDCFLKLRSDSMSSMWGGAGG